MSVRRLAIGIVAGLALVGCNRADMVQQPKSRDWDRNAFFPDQSTMRMPIAGTQPRDEPNLPVLQPATITATILERGRQRFDIFCSPCHGTSGDGQGMIVQRGFPAPPPFTNDALVKSKAAFFYDVITNGHGDMYSYADRVPPADRWAIIAYIRALQVSQGASLAALPAEDRAALERLP